MRLLNLIVTFSFSCRCLQARECGCPSLSVFVWVCVSVYARESVQFLHAVSIWCGLWPEDICGTMSELEQLRQEADQLRNQIRVRQYSIVCSSMPGCIYFNLWNEHTSKIITCSICFCLFSRKCQMMLRYNFFLKVSLSWKCCLCSKMCTFKEIVSWKPGTS